MTASDTQLGVIFAGWALALFCIWLGDWIAARKNNRG